MGGRPRRTGACPRARRGAGGPGRRRRTGRRPRRPRRRRLAPPAPATASSPAWATVATTSATTRSTSPTPAPSRRRRSRTRADRGQGHAGAVALRPRLLRRLGALGPRRRPAARRSSGRARSSSSPRAADPRPPALRRVATPPARASIDPAVAGDLNKVVATAWFATPSGSITAAQPNGAHRIFPSNDVPSDPARYTIRACDAGRLDLRGQRRAHRQRTAGGRTRGATRSASRWPPSSSSSRSGPHRPRRGRPSAACACATSSPTSRRRARAGARRAPATTWFMIDEVGRYPFRTYGSLCSDATFPFALEDQTLSLYPAFVVLAVAGHAVSATRGSTSRSWSTSWPTSGSATRRARPAGATSGSTRATPPGTSWSTRSSAASRPSTSGAARFESRCAPPTPRATSFAPPFGPVAAPIHGADASPRLLQPQRLRGRRARPLRAAPGGRRPRLPRDRARVAARRRRPGVDRGLHRLRVARWRAAT